MGMIFTGLKPKSEIGKRFQVNNKGWNALINVLNECEETEDIADELEYEGEAAAINSKDSVMIVEALKAKGDDAFKNSTEEYKPMIKEFAEFCKESGGFVIC